MIHSGIQAGVRVCLLCTSLLSKEKLEELALRIIDSSLPHQGVKRLSRRTEFLAGRAALSEVLFQLNIVGRVVADPQHGYLTLQGMDGNRLSDCINISHTYGIAAGCISPSPVGIDIEKSDRDVTKVLKRVCTPEELQFCRQSPQVKAGVPSGLAMWTGKESVSKALGLGIKFGMKAFALHLGGNSPYPVSYSLRGPLEMAEPSVDYILTQGILVAICAERKVLEKGITLSWMKPILRES